MAGGCVGQLSRLIFLFYFDSFHIRMTSTHTQIKFDHNLYYFFFGFRCSRNRGRTSLRTHWRRLRSSIDLYCSRWTATACDLVQRDHTIGNYWATFAAGTTNTCIRTSSIHMISHRFNTNNNILFYGQSFFEQNRGNRHTLIIRNVTYSDLGNYTCQASNTWGKDRAPLALSGIPTVCTFESVSRACVD